MTIPTVRQLAVEIANLAHKGWYTPDNAEFLYTAIEERAKDIIEGRGSVNPRRVERHGPLPRRKGGCASVNRDGCATCSQTERGDD